MGYINVVAALEERELQTTTPSAYRCPAHEDRQASLSVREGDNGTALLYCHAGCVTADVVAALDLTMSDLWTGKTEGTAIAATYVYEDESNVPLYRVLRLSPKGFFQERMEDGEWKPGMREVRRVLYHLPQLVRLAPDAPVYVVEGEKDADNIIERTDAFATTLLGGANKWLDEYREFFTDRDVRIVLDSDEAGQKHADMLREKLTGTARSITILAPAVGKDVTNHLLAGLSLADLVEPDSMSEFDPWDWTTYETPDTEWLFEPYIPRAARVLAFGASGSLKSLWAAWLGAKLAAEGKRVAYFSLEMPRGVFAKRMRQLPPFPTTNFKVFGKFMLGMNLQTAIAAFEGYDLLIVDSWSQAQGAMGGNDNDAISMMDAEFFQPLIAATGATLLVLDNTGKDTVTNEGKVAADTARGASRKLDIQEIGLWFRRTDENNNFRTRISCKKMRLDVPQPSPVTVETPQDRIEFYYVDSGMMTAVPMWPGVEPDVPIPSASSTGVEPVDLSSQTTEPAPASPPEPTSSAQDGLRAMLEAAPSLGIPLRERARLRKQLAEAEEAYEATEATL